jgi:hypothetical protein
MIIILNGWLPTVQFYSQRNARYATLGMQKILDARELRMVIC